MNTTKIKTQQEITSTAKVLEADGEWKNEFGVTYSADKTKLISAPKELDQYFILDGTKVICDCAFLSCDRLKRVILPNSITTIGTAAFSNCSELIDINIPDSVKTIGFGAFLGCANLRRISIPKSVETIDGSAFVMCDNLTKIEVEGENFIFEDGILYSAGYESIVATLSACLEVDVKIKEGVKNIKAFAFANCCDVESVTIPSSVINIEEDAFSECENLSSISVSELMNPALFTKLEHEYDDVTIVVD